MMTKKDFVALAITLRPMIENGNEIVNVDEVINRLSQFCETQNPQFNKSRWLGFIAGECGSNGGKIKDRAH